MKTYKKKVITFDPEKTRYEWKEFSLNKIAASDAYKNIPVTGKHQTIKLSEAVDLLDKCTPKQKYNLLKLINASLDVASRKRIEQFNLDTKLQKADKLLKAQTYYNYKDHQLRWSEITDKSEAYFNNLSEEQRQQLLDRAADLGVSPKETTIDTKELYTMRMAELADPDYKIYHEIDGSEPIKTIVGNYHTTIVTRQAENEAMAIAMYLTQNYGDEFLLRTNTPEGTVTLRDIRLGLVDDEPISFKDFQYEQNYDDYEGGEN